VRRTHENLGRERRVLHETLQHRQRRANNGGRECVGEEVRPRPLAEQRHNFLGARCVPAQGPTKRFAQRRIDDVDTRAHVAVLRRAAARCTEEAGGVAFIDKKGGLKISGQPLSAVTEGERE
jgi:hypothetical protein